MREKICSLLFFLGLFSFFFFPNLAGAQDASDAADDATNDTVNELIQKALSAESETKVINNDISANEPAKTQSDTSGDSQVAEPAVFVNIESPKSHEVMVNTSAKISGKTIPGVLVEVTVADDDLHKRFIRHTNPAKVTGTTTSDKNGDWVYVPQTELAPGEYSVIANYKDPTKGAVASETIYFTATGADGAVEIPIFAKSWLYGALVFFVAALTFFITLHFVRRRKVRPPLFVQPERNKAAEKIPGRESRNEDILTDEAEDFFSPSDSKRGSLKEKKLEEAETATLFLKHVLKEVSQELQEAMDDFDGLEEEIEKSEKPAGRKKSGQAKKIRETARKVEKDLEKVAGVIEDTKEEVDEMRSGIERNRPRGF